MLVVAIFSIFAAISFRKMTDEKGYDGKCVSSYPVIAGVAVIVLGLILTEVAKRVIKDESSVLLTAYPMVIGIFSILIHGAFVSKLWRQIKKLPSHRDE